jgi:hypothetical protein
MQQYNEERGNWKNLLYPPVLWIRVIFVRIWIRGFVPLTFGFGSGSCSGSCSFRQGPSRCQQYFFCLLLFEGHLHKSLKIKKSHKDVTKLFLLDEGSIRIRTINDGSGSGRSKNIRVLRIRIHNTGIHIVLLHISEMFLQSYKSSINKFQTSTPRNWNSLDG